MSQCNGKESYSKNEAQRIKGEVGRNINKGMRIYPCENCGRYHLTKRKRHSY